MGWDIFGIGEVAAAASNYASNMYTNEQTMDRQLQAQSYNSAQTMQAQAYNTQSMQNAQAYNSAEAVKGREFSAGQQLQAEDFNAAQANINRDFQQQMSSTAYQRATADMKAAGINPMAAYQQGGASSPSGSSAGVGAVGGPSASSGAASSGFASSPSPPGVASMAGAIGSALEYARTRADVANRGADTSLKAATEQYTKAQEKVADKQAINIDAQTATERARKVDVEASADQRDTMSEVAEGQRGRIGVGPISVDPAGFGQQLQNAGTAAVTTAQSLYERFKSGFKSVWDGGSE
ncbi:DNA pilot protein [Blackfly microvirus SF02]|uniref:DNA pilot protein n=1 Tax=Blackfly microvirus SF02 TaxID=2576452 RepID=A0A4P8PTT3_9VIRU|nr:DNA pilot protein [Blackfly microvirus SF02]